MKGKSSQGGSNYKILNIFFFLLPISIFTVALLLFSKHSDVLAQSSTLDTVTTSDVRLIAFGVDDESVKERYNPKIVSIKKGKSVYRVLTNKTDISDILNDFYITLNSNERISCSTGTVKDGCFIKLIRTENVVEYLEVVVPHEVETVKSSKYATGEKHIKQKGVDGLTVQKIVHYYEDGRLLKSEIVEERVKEESVTEIVEVGTSTYSLSGIEKRGYDCKYWFSVVDSGPYTPNEKEWLKFVMYCESGCNAESNKGYYKGLFQWSPSLWSKQFPENIFDGHAQLKHTLEKYRAGAAGMWPACNRKYNAEN